MLGFLHLSSLQQQVGAHLQCPVVVRVNLEVTLTELDLYWLSQHGTPCSDIKIVKFCDISHQGDPTFVELPCRPCVEVTIHLTRLDFFLKSIFSSFFLFLLHLIVLKCFSFLEKSLARSLVGFKTEARTVGYNITYMCVLMDSFDVIGYEFLGRR